MKKIKQKQKENPNIIYGIHTVLGVIDNNPERIKKIYLSRSKNIEEIKRKAHGKKVQIEEMSKDQLEKLFGISKEAQGVIAEVSDFIYTPLNDVLNKKRLLLLDAWQDAKNLGRAIRSAACFGVDAIIIVKDKSVQINASAQKAAVGALSFMPVVRVTNLKQTIDELKKNNFFVYGADERGENNIYNISFADKSAIVIGQEGKGLRSLTKKNCDVLVHIPMHTKDMCLNAADSATIFLYELNRE